MVSLQHAEKYFIQGQVPMQLV